MRLNKVSELIHNSTNHQNLNSAGVSVHFQEIIDLVISVSLLGWLHNKRNLTLGWLFKTCSNLILKYLILMTFPNFICNTYRMMEHMNLSQEVIL